MAILPIRTFGDPVLREKARPIERFDDVHKTLVRDMLDTMRAAPGVGLAGPQIGVVERIFVWEVDEQFGAVINPVITRRSDETDFDEEGCLSLPELLYPVERALAVTVEGLDENGRRVRIEAEGFVARVYQHEIDHLDGVLFIDHLPEEMRKDALRRLREQALGLAPQPSPARARNEEIL